MECLKVCPNKSMRPTLRHWRATDMGPSLTDLVFLKCHFSNVHRLCIIQTDGNLLGRALAMLQSDTAARRWPPPRPPGSSWLRCDGHLRAVWSKLRLMSTAAAVVVVILESRVRPRGHHPLSS